MKRLAAEVGESAVGDKHGLNPQMTACDVMEMLGDGFCLL
jgi:hypothetical protein